MLPSRAESFEEGWSSELDICQELVIVSSKGCAGSDTASYTESRRLSTLLPSCAKWI